MLLWLDGVCVLGVKHDKWMCFPVVIYIVCCRRASVHVHDIWKDKFFFKNWGIISGVIYVLRIAVLNFTTIGSVSKRALLIVAMVMTLRLCEIPSTEVWAMPRNFLSLPGLITKTLSFLSSWSSFALSSTALVLEESTMKRHVHKKLSLQPIAIKPREFP